MVLAKITAMHRPVFAAAGSRSRWLLSQPTEAEGTSSQATMSIRPCHMPGALPPCLATSRGWKVCRREEGISHGFCQHCHPPEFTARVTSDHAQEKGYLTVDSFHEQMQFHKAKDLQLCHVFPKWVLHGFRWVIEKLPYCFSVLSSVA